MMIWNIMILFHMEQTVLLGLFLMISHFCYVGVDCIDMMRY